MNFYLCSTRIGLCCSELFATFEWMVIQDVVFTICYSIQSPVSLVFIGNKYHI